MCIWCTRSRLWGYNLYKLYNLYNLRILKPDPFGVYPCDLLIC